MAFAQLSHLWRAHLGQVLKEGKTLDDMSPILSSIRKTLPDHVHDLTSGQGGVCQVCNLIHELCVRSPLVVTRCFSDLQLGKRVIFDYIFDGSTNGHHWWS